MLVGASLHETCPDLYTAENTEQPTQRTAEEGPLFERSRLLFFPLSAGILLLLRLKNTHSPMKSAKQVILSPFRE